MRRDPKPPVTTAFTLIELVVALLLGTLLLITLMGVLRHSFSVVGTSLSDEPLTMRRDVLIEQLRRDLTNARRMQVGINRFELAGFIHRDPATLIATHRPARVLYEVRKNGRLSILFRTQTDEALALTSQSGQLVEPVFLGAGDLVVSTNRIGAFSDADQIGLGIQGKSNASAARRLEVPGSVQVVLTDQRGRTVINQTFTRLREG